MKIKTTTKKVISIEFVFVLFFVLFLLLFILEVEFEVDNKQNNEENKVLALLAEFNR